MLRDAIIQELDSKLASLNASNPLVLLLIANIYVLAEVSFFTDNTILFGFLIIKYLFIEFWNCFKSIA